MFLTIAYDCTDNKRRRRLVKVLLDYGYRVQHSVFEVEVKEKTFLEMLRRLKKEIDEEEDSLRIYHLCSRCLDQTEIFGVKGLTNQEDLFVI